MQVRRQLWRIFLLAGLTIAAVVFGLWLLYRFPGTMSENRQGAIVVSTTQPGMEGLRVRMWVDNNMVRPGEAARMRLRFENDSREDITGLAIIDEQEPGFRYVPVKMKGFTILPGESVESEPVDLVPSTDGGRYKVTVRYLVRGTDMVVHEGAIASQPITIRNDAADRRNVFIRRALSVFTLPLLLALIGFWLQRRQAAEARRQEIWKTILPNFYSLSEKHYIPIVRSLRAVVRNRPENAATATAEQTRRLMFEFLFLLLRMDIFRKRRGQFFFKSRQGEQVASQAWQILKLGSDEMLGSTCVESVIEKMSTKMNYRAFCLQLATVPEHMEVEGKFLAWIRTAEPGRGFDQYVNLVELMQLAVYFEANRPFDRDWYEVGAEFNMKAADQYSYPSPAASDSEKTKATKLQRIDDLKKAVTAYKAEVTAYLASLPRPEI
jgi:hypothetical protein